MALQHQSEQSGGRIRGDPERTANGTEFLVLRNYDWEQTYEIEVTLTGTDGRSIEPRPMELGPGQVLTVLEAFPEGRYRAHASIPGDEDTVEGVFGSDPGEFALVEVGNGIVSITAEWP